MGMRRETCETECLEYGCNATGFVGLTRRLEIRVVPPGQPAVPLAFPPEKKKLAIPLLCQLWQNWPGLKAGSIRFFNAARLAGIKTTEGYEFEQFGKMKKYIYRVTMSTSDKNIDSSTCFLSIFLCEL